MWSLKNEGQGVPDVREKKLHCVRVRARVHLCVHTCVGQRTAFGIFFSHGPFFFFMNRSLAGGQQAPEIYLSLLPSARTAGISVFLCVCVFV